MWTQAAFDEGTGKDVLMTLYDSMVESYEPKSAAERIAVQQEVMQLIALAGLARGGFFVLPVATKAKMRTIWVKNA